MGKESDAGTEGLGFGKGIASMTTFNTTGTARTLKNIKDKLLEKVRVSFVEDALAFSEGTIPQSIVVGTVVVVLVCDIVAYLYYTLPDYLFGIMWNNIPE